MFQLVFDYILTIPSNTGDPFPGGAFTSKTRAQGTSTILYAALDPSLGGKWFSSHRDCE